MPKLMPFLVSYQAAYSEHFKINVITCNFMTDSTYFNIFIMSIHVVADISTSFFKWLNSPLSGHTIFCVSVQLDSGHLDHVYILAIILLLLYGILWSRISRSCGNSVLNHFWSCQTFPQHMLVAV